eukprot:228300-Ditylum_brightwellii.AAC.1
MGVQKFNKLLHTYIAFEFLAASALKSTIMIVLDNKWLIPPLFFKGINTMYMAFNAFSFHPDTSSCTI